MLNNDKLHYQSYLKCKKYVPDVRIRFFKYCILGIYNPGVFLPVKLCPASVYC